MYYFYSYICLGQNKKNMQLIYSKATALGIPISEINRYNEPHRFYHNMSHIESMINSAIKKNILSDELFLAIIFHEITKI